MIEYEHNYAKALEAAGAKVLLFKEFGSYQGDWLALVVLPDRSGWVRGSFGSCSGCDAFESEFGWKDEKEDPEEYNIKLKAFGENYLEQIMNDEEALKEVSRNLDWDTDAQGMVDFINKHKGAHSD